MPRRFRSMGFEQAKQAFPLRFTMENIPHWAGVSVNGLYHAPQYATDREWYDNTIFPGEEGGDDRKAISQNQTYPLGRTMKTPFTTSSVHPSLPKPATPSAKFNRATSQMDDPFPNIKPKEVVDEEIVDEAERRTTQAATAAKALRNELKSTFPGLKFTVKSSNFAGGDAIDASVTNQPPSRFRAIEAIANKYQYGSFDGMTDSYNYDNKVEGLPQVKYVMVNNNRSDEMDDFIHEFMNKTFSKESINGNRSLPYHLFIGASHVDEISTDMWNQWYAKHPADKPPVVESVIEEGIIEVNPEDVKQGDIIVDGNHNEYRETVDSVTTNSGGNTVVRLNNDTRSMILRKGEKVRIFKEGYSKSLYYLQPDGSYKKGGDGRSEGLKKEDLPKGAKIK